MATASNCRERTLAVLGICGLIAVIIIMMSENETKMNCFSFTLLGVNTRTQEEEGEEENWKISSLLQTDQFETNCRCCRIH